MQRAAILLSILLLAVRIASASDSVLEFDVFLDQRPVGTHRFEIQRGTDAVQVKSVAAFKVRILGIPAYRYQHQASERWSKGCLQQIESSTDDDGHRSQVSRVMQGGCTISYAYWDPGLLLHQHELLNPQTGETDAVRIAATGEETITVRGKPVRADRYRLDSDRFVIDLWYSKQGEWLQLASTTSSKRKLHYRLATR